MLDQLTDCVLEAWCGLFPGMQRPSEFHYLVSSGSIEGGTTTFLAFADKYTEPVFVVKVARYLDEAPSLEREAEILHDLHMKGDFFRQSVPKSLMCIKIGENPCLIQSVLSGSPMLAEVGADGLPDMMTARANMQLATEWLIECHQATMLRSDKTGYEWYRTVQQQTKEFGTVFGLNEEQSVRVVLDRIRDELEDIAAARIGLCLRHGDFCRHNVLVSARPGVLRLGVIDWTYSRPTRLPLHDLVFFLGTYCLQVRKESGIAGFESTFTNTFFDDNSYSALVRECILRYCQALEIDLDVVRTLFAISLIDQALFEHRQVVRAVQRGGVPRFSMFMAMSEGRRYEDMAKAQIWARFFRLFAQRSSSFIL